MFNKGFGNEQCVNPLTGNCQKWMIQFGVPTHVLPEAKARPGHAGWGGGQASIF